MRLLIIAPVYWGPLVERPTVSTLSVRLRTALNRGTLWPEKKVSAGGKGANTQAEAHQAGVSRYTCKAFCALHYRRGPEATAAKVPVTADMPVNADD